MAPLIVELTSTRWAWSTSLFGSFSATSFWSPTTQARALLTHHLLTSRASYVPGGPAGATVTLNLVIGGRGGLGPFFLGSGGGVGGMIGSPLMPGWLKRRLSGSSTSVPAKTTSTVVPALAPAGVRTVSRGCG